MKDLLLLIHNCKFVTSDRVYIRRQILQDFFTVSAGDWLSAGT